MYFMERFTVHKICVDAFPLTKVILVSDDTLGNTKDEIWHG